MTSHRQIGPITRMSDQLIREDSQYSTHIDLNLEMQFPKLENPINITFFDNLMKLHSIIDSKYNEYTRYGNKDLPSKVETNLHENNTVVTIKGIHGYLKDNLPYEISKLITNIYNVDHIECKVTGDLLNEFHVLYKMANTATRDN